MAITSEVVEVIDERTAHERFKKQLQDRPHLKTLHEEAKKRGYQIHDEPGETFAIRVRTKANRELPPRAGVAGSPVGDIEFELVGQSISKGGAQGALATSTIRGGGHEETYEMLLEAPQGNFRQTREFTIQHEKIVETHSWWSAWVGCLRNSCSSTCLNALWQCTGTWTAYFWCVVGRCGGCVVKCAACSTCDCSWWCRWAVGCCDR
jgi:hypothetical protein